jgi:hypothetical protein
MTTPTNSHKPWTDKGGHVTRADATAALTATPARAIGFASYYATSNWTINAAPNASVSIGGTAPNNTITLESKNNGGGLSNAPDQKRAGSYRLDRRPLPPSSASGCWADFMDEEGDLIGCSAFMIQKYAFPIGFLVIVIKTDTILSQREGSLFADMGKWFLLSLAFSTLDRPRCRLIDTGH